MMIIDTHAHIGDPWFAYWKKNVTVDDHIAAMDKFGIEKSCVSWWQIMNAPDEGNVEISNAVKRYPDRLFGFAVINPRWLQGAVDEIDRARNDSGMVGLKLHPDACQFHADSHIMNPVMERAIEYNFPMLFHCEGVGAYSSAAKMENLAKRFPEATIILAHMGLTAWFETITMAALYDNLILDTAASRNWYRIINFAIEQVGEDRIVWGSDFPATNIGPEMAKITEADITDAQKSKLLGENAARILGIQL